MSSILCFYHAPCNDGAASVAALKYRLRHSGLPEAESEVYDVQMAHTTDWLQPYEQRFVDQIQPSHPVSTFYILDAIISRPKFDQILGHLRSIGKLTGDAPRTVCIDHHGTAIDKQEELGAFCDELLIRIGPGLSAATLVWQYFNDRLQVDIPRPQLLNYVADQDVWEWSLPDSREVNAALNTLEGNAEEMERELAESLKDEKAWLNRRKEQGRTVLAMVEAQVHKAMAHVVDIPLASIVLRVVNSSAFSSELGNHLCSHSPVAPNAVALVYSVQRDWSVKCSLRSVGGSSVNARTLAERFGGGGHDNAAGCRFATFTEFIHALNSLKPGPG